MTKPSRQDFDLNSLLHPARAFPRPIDVVEDPDLTVTEKRAILASWASDACAVQDTPALRRPAEGASVSFDDVMDALKKLDGAEVENPSYAKLMTRAHRLKAIFDQSPTGSPIVLGGSRKRPSRRGQGSDDSPMA